MINRHIFTSKPSRTDTLLDYLCAVVIGLCLTMAALSYFDVLIIPS
jgi:hypothetical protein